MVTTVVQFPLPETLPAEAVRQRFQEIASDFQQPRGLMRKYFLLGGDGRSAGGVYLWASRRDAEAFYGGGFVDLVRQRYGATPTITYFETPVVVDNVARQIVEAAITR